MSKGRVGLALGGVLLIFVGMQAIGLQLRWVEDETWYLLPTQTLVQEGHLRIPVFNTPERRFFAAPPLLPLLEALSWSLRDMTIIQARSLTLLFGCGSIVLTYLLGRQLLDERIGLFAAMLAAMDNTVFLASRTVRPEILVVFFNLLALWLLLLSIRDGKLLFAALAGVAVGAGMSSHPNGAIAPLCGVLLILVLERWQALRQPRLYVFAAASTVAFLPYLISVVVLDARNGGDSLRALGSMQVSSHESVLQRLVHSATGEWQERYLAFVAFPYRVHVGLIAIGSVVVGTIWGNRASRYLVGCVLLHLFFFATVTNANKSPRYLALTMPFVALLWAQGIVFLWRNQERGSANLLRWVRSGPLKLVATVLFVLAGISQLGGNVVYLWQSRQANVANVCREIDVLIPQESTIYGGMAFWIGLRDHAYVPYQRMPWQQAIDEYHPTIVILDDRVMVHGSYAGEWDTLRSELHEYVGAHGRLVGRVSNSFYGDLNVFEVSYGPMTKKDVEPMANRLSEFMTRER